MSIQLITSADLPDEMIEVDALWLKDKSLKDTHLNDSSAQSNEENLHTLVLLCHPHPLFGGTMDNKVITTLARFYHKRHCHVVRFNFRGVGQSSGQHAYGVGEIDDAIRVLDWAVEQLAERIKQSTESQTQPTIELILAGFSFGAYITASVVQYFKTLQFHSAHVHLKNVILVAPAVHHNPMQQMLFYQPTCVVVADADEVVPVPAILSWIDTVNARTELLRQQHSTSLLPVLLTTAHVPDASHFFHLKLSVLTEQLAQFHHANP